jgi:hypothetical protein
LTNFAYIWDSHKFNADMSNNVANDKILYVNRYTNVIYNENDLLELDVKKKSKEVISEVVFNLYSKVLLNSYEQRLVFYHLTYDKEEYTITKLCKFLENKYDKSERTYRRAIDTMFGKGLLKLNNRILYIHPDYDLSLLDLDNVKGIMIHII